MYKGYLVNRLKFLSYSKDGLNVVITQLLDQVSNRGIILLNIQTKLNKEYGSCEDTINEQTIKLRPLLKKVNI